MEDKDKELQQAQALEMELEWIRKGKEAYARMDWKACLDSYAEAIKLNAASEAVELRKMAMSIIEFYNKNQYNP